MTISSAVNVLIVGLLLVVFVIIAPNGIVGLVQKRLRRRPAMTALLHVDNSASASAASSRSTASISRCSRASASA